MKQFGGLALIATLFAGSASADLVNFEFTPNGSVVHYHRESGPTTVTVVASAGGMQSTQLQLPTGALTMEYLNSDYYPDNQATITNGFSAFENYPLDAVTQPFLAQLANYLPASFSTMQGYAVLSASNWFWDYDAEAEANGEVDYGANLVGVQFDRWETLESEADEFGSNITTMFQSFNFLISVGAVPSSGADVARRTADDVRALFSGLNGETGTFRSSVSVQQTRCEQNNCWQTLSDLWQIRGRVSAQGERTIDVPVPATALLLALGLPLLRRNRRA